MSSIFESSVMKEITKNVKKIQEDRIKSNKKMYDEEISNYNKVSDKIESTFYITNNNIKSCYAKLNSKQNQDFRNNGKFNYNNCLYPNYDSKETWKNPVECLVYDPDLKKEISVTEYGIPTNESDETNDENRICKPIESQRDEAYNLIINMNGEFDPNMKVFPYFNLISDLTYEISNGKIDVNIASEKRPPVVRSDRIMLSFLSQYRLYLEINANNPTNLSKSGIILQNNDISATIKQSDIIKAIILLEIPFITRRDYIVEFTKPKSTSSSSFDSLLVGYGSFWKNGAKMVVLAAVGGLLLSLSDISVAKCTVSAALIPSVEPSTSIPIQSIGISSFKDMFENNFEPIKEYLTNSTVTEVTEFVNAYSETKTQYFDKVFENEVCLEEKLPYLRFGGIINQLFDLTPNQIYASWGGDWSIIKDYADGITEKIGGIYANFFNKSYEYVNSLNDVFPTEKGLQDFLLLNGGEEISKAIEKLPKGFFTETNVIGVAGLLGIIGKIFNVLASQFAFQKSPLEELDIDALTEFYKTFATQILINNK